MALKHIVQKANSDATPVIPGSNPQGFESIEAAESYKSKLENTGKILLRAYKRMEAEQLDKIITNQKNLEENADKNSGVGGKTDYSSMRGLLGDYSPGQLEQRLGSNGDDALGVMDIWRRRTRGM